MHAMEAAMTAESIIHGQKVSSVDKTDDAASFSSQKPFSQSTVQ
jgi:hypothetical protein